MNFRMIARYVGLVMRLQTVCMLPACLFSLIQGEHMAARGFLLTLLITLSASVVLGFVKFNPRHTVYIKDGFVSVAICWIVISFTGALPFWFSREIPSFINALVEAVSGFTATGATILTDVEAMSRGLLLWRNFTHWIGGMGVLVFLLALVPSTSGGERGISLLRAESPGPSPGKLVPKLRQSAKILYLIYLGLTLLQFLLLYFGGMPLFDSVVTAMATAGTGGFTVKGASIAAYHSIYIEIVIGVFMMLFGINFNVYYFLLSRNFSSVYKNEELRVYLGIIIACTLMIGFNLNGTIYGSLPESLHHAFFQVSSVISSTGFSTSDFNVWPMFSKMLLFTLMFVGSCAGSTGSGFKVSRVIILFRETRRTLYRIVHPRTVETVKLNGKTVDKTVVHAVNTYLSTYILIFVCSVLLVSLDNFDFETSLTSVAACMNNIGPGFGVVGPGGSFSAFSTLSKLVLSANMLLGRLEIYPILLLLWPRTWERV